MFNNHQDNQSSQNTDIDQVAKDIDESAPHIGIGTNPSSFSPVMPSQSQTNPASNDITADDVTSAPPMASPALPSNLSNIKEEALKQLSPLVGKLDQSPEEKFKTLMMMIQAADNHDLIQEAYDTANKIEDETAKAQALLAIVNEINYFTQKQAN